MEGIGILKIGNITYMGYFVQDVLVDGFRREDGGDQIKFYIH